MGDYEAIGKAFVDQFYGMFDDASKRASLQGLYTDSSMLSYEGATVMGAANIIQKFVNLPFQVIRHSISTTDAQPTPEGGILVVVNGQLKTDNDPAHSFSETFVLRSNAGSYFIQHHVFRLNIHNF